MTAGCTTLSIESPAGPAGHRTYIGVVTVQAPIDPDLPLTPARVRQLDVSAIGLRIDRGVTLGYMRDRLLSVPLDCRLVVFIRAAPDLVHAERMLRASTKEDLCIAHLSE
jgi:hypothetical protein